MQYIHSENAPEAIGPYSQAVMVKDTLYCSGQIAIDPRTKKMIDAGVAEQSEQVLKNLVAVVRSAGLDVNNIVKTTIYLTNIADFKLVNEIYGSFFKDHKPARATVEVANLPAGSLVEIDCIAIKF